MFTLNTIASSSALFLSNLLHSLYDKTGYTSVLLMEFKIARTIHLNKDFIKFLVISSYLCFQFMLLLSYNDKWISLMFVAFLILQMVYYLISALQTKKMSHGMIETLTASLLSKSFLFNSDLLQTKLNKEIKSHQATVQALENKNGALPKEINSIIADYVFHEPIQQLSSEEMASKLLKSKCNMDDKIIQHIIGFASELSPESDFSFQIGYGEGYGGNLSGKVLLQTSSIPREIKLNVNFGKSQNEIKNNHTLEYDINSQQLLDIKLKETNKKFNYNKVAVPVRIQN